MRGKKIVFYKLLEQIGLHHGWGIGGWGKLFGKKAWAIATI